MKLLPAESTIGHQGCTTGDTWLCICTTAAFISISRVIPYNMHCISISPKHSLMKTARVEQKQQFEAVGINNSSSISIFMRRSGGR